MKNTVKLLDNGIIYVEKAGDQTQRSMMELFERISKLATQLRTQGKPVLILSNAQQEQRMEGPTRKIAAAIGRSLDYDKSATFGSSQALDMARGLLISQAHLETKVADFATRQEAVDWLLG